MEISLERLLAKIGQLTILLDIANEHIARLEDEWKERGSE